MKYSPQSWYQRQMFDPGMMGWLVNPFFLARRELMRHLRPLLGELKGQVLDVGCGRKPYEALVAADTYVGLDFDSPVTRELAAADVFYAGGAFPFAEARFDGALCTQVLEHVFTPHEFLEEISRVLMPGGVLILTVPFIWDEHEQPHDFGRYSSFGLKAMLEAHGFELVSQNKSGAGGLTLAQMTVGYWYKTTRTQSRFWNAVVQLLVLAPMTFIGWILSSCLPADRDLYLDNIVWAKKRK